MLAVCPWTVPPLEPQLSDQEIHIWQADLLRLDAGVETLTPLLSPDEQQRAARFRFEHDRRKYILCRGILRTILSQYLQRDPIALTFDYGKYGKPSLTGCQALSFNLAHAGDRALYAVTQHHAIGVDIEQLRFVEYAEQIVSRYFSSAEKQAFQSLPENQQQLAFFRAWTGKEAFLKAIGSGLSLPLDQVAVTLLPSQPARLVGLPAGYLIHQWQLHQFVPSEDYVGAIVLPQKPFELYYWQVSLANSI
jgi:4'-phosphopantetheinyl transferase